MSTNSNEEYLLEVKDLHTSFFTESGEVKAVNGVQFYPEAGRGYGNCRGVRFRKECDRLFNHADSGGYRSDRRRAGVVSVDRIWHSLTANRWLASAENAAVSFSRIR